MNKTLRIHPFAPVYAPDSRVLILGTIPSPASLSDGFYYGHPRNRFWPLLATIFNEPRPQSTDEKTALLLRHRIALWDVLAACEIEGASDAAIQQAVPNDIPALMKQCAIKTILLNGGTAHKLYTKHFADIDCPTVPLPSTSPANAAWPLERLVPMWRAGLER